MPQGIERFTSLLVLLWTYGSFLYLHFWVSWKLQCDATFISICVRSRFQLGFAPLTLCVVICDGSKILNWFQTKIRNGFLVFDFANVLLCLKEALTATVFFKFLAGRSWMWPCLPMANMPLESSTWRKWLRLKLRRSLRRKPPPTDSRWADTSDSTCLVEFPK